MKKFDINQIQERELFCAGLEVRESGDGQGRTISGHAIVFDRESNILWQDDEEVAVEIIDREAIPQELLDNSDIKMTMYHNREKLLARSNQGSGTLSYAIDDTGVGMSKDELFDKAMESYNGMPLIPLACYGDQVVAGSNYHLICRENTGGNVSECKLKKVVVYN